MTYVTILCATLAVTSAQIYRDDPEKQISQEKTKTIIQNKNVNIIVNLNPEEVATELWKMIEARLSSRTSHLTSSKSTIKELEKAVTPLVSPTRRGKTSPSAFQVASQLDKIARRTLTRDKPTIDKLDEEIMARDIVADMMASLKIFLSETIQSKINEVDASSRRTMHNTVMISDDKQDDYVNVRIKMHKKDIINALN